MRSLAIINQKGGVGKTTTAVNLAAGLARDGQRVLLVDLDPQSHATLHVGLDVSPESPTVYDVLVDGVPLERASRAVAERLVAVPSGADLVSAEIELAGRDERDTLLRQAVLPTAERYDYTVIDCGPSLGLLTINALVAVEEVLIPLQPHFLALQGLGRLLETITVVRRSRNPGLRVAGVVLCMYERGTRLAQEVQDDVAQFLAHAEPGAAWHGARVLATTIRRNIKLAECPSFGQTIFDYAPGSHGAEDYAALASELAALELPRAARESPTADSATPEVIAP